MLAAAEYTNCSTKPKIYENDWINNYRRRISWLNFLTVQPIPEETDVIDCPKHIRNNSDSSSSSSIEDCYIVLEVQRPRLIDEQLNFAQINEDKHNVEYEQFTEPIIIEVPLQRNTVEHQSEQMLINKEHVKVTEVHIHEPKKSDKSVLISKNDPPNFTNEQHYCPITNLSSIKNKTHISNSIQTEQEKSTLETTTLTRIFTFDRTCMEKSDRAKEQEINDNETHIKEQSVFPFDLDKLNNLPNPSTFFRLIKKHTRTIKSGYYLHDDKMKINEPTLLQVKYVDGRQTLTDLNALESMQKFQLSLFKNSYKQDLSYRKRIFNRVQNFLKSTNSNEQSIPWQQKTILELYHERKNKINRY